MFWSRTKQLIFCFSLARADLFWTAQRSDVTQTRAWRQVSRREHQNETMKWTQNRKFGCSCRPRLAWLCGHPGFKSASGDILLTDANQTAAGDNAVIQKHLDSRRHRKKKEEGEEEDAPTWPPPPLSTRAPARRRKRSSELRGARADEDGCSPAPPAPPPPPHLRHR